MAEPDGLSIELRSGLHSNVALNRIWTSQESVYGDSPIGKLEQTMVSRLIPLQQGFHGYGKTSLSVAVHDEAASFASEQGVVGGIVAFPDSTAAGAPLARMPTIHNVQPDSFIEASLLKVPSERIEGNPHDLPIEPLSFRTKTLQVFNGDIGIVLEGEIRNVSNYFTDPVFHKVVFPLLRSIQLLLSRLAASIRIGTQKALTLKYFLTFHPNILAKIHLLQHVAFRRQDCEGEAFAVHINPKNVPSFRHVIGFLREMGGNLQVRGQPEGFAGPPASKQAVKPIPIFVLFNGNSNPLSRDKSEFNKTKFLRFECLAISGNVEFDGHPTNSHTFLPFSPSAPSKVADDLTVESCSLLGFGADATPELVEFPVLATLAEKPVNFNSSGLLEVTEGSLFGESGIGLKKDSALQPTDQEVGAGIKCLTVSTQFLPPLKGVGFLGCF